MGNSPPFLVSVRKDLRGLLSSGPLSSPPVKILMASGAPHPHGTGKALVKASGKLEHLCRSSERSFHLKLSTTGAVTELNIETNINSLIILCSEMCSLIMTVKLFEAGMSLCAHEMALIPFQLLVLKNGAESFSLVQGVLFSVDQKLLLAVTWPSWSCLGRLLLILSASPFFHLDGRLRN